MTTTLRAGSSGPPVVVLTPGDIPDVPEPGPNYIYLYPYIVENEGNLADAVSQALTEHPTGKICLVYPPGSFEQARQIGNFDGTDGLRSDVTFRCDGECHITRPASASFTIFYAFPQGTDAVNWEGIFFHVADTAIAGAKAIQAYSTTRWRIERCGLICDDIPTNQGNGIAILLSGSRDTVVTNCYLKRGQVGFGGLGYGCNGVVFSNNTCDDVHDFAVSAVTGPPEEDPLEIKNVVISGNTIRGMNGSGAIFVGSDGGTFPADVVSGIEITGNTIIGGVEEGHIGVRTTIVFCSGKDTSLVNISDNVIGDDSGSTQTQYGIFVSTCNGATSFTGLQINNNQIGPLGAAGGVKGIYVDTTLLDDSAIKDNILQGNRGIYVANPVNLELSGNQVYNATSDAVEIVASSRNISGIRIKDNFFETTTLFAVALRLTTTGSRTAALQIEETYLRATAGACAAYTPNAGSAAIDWIDNEWETGIEAVFLAAIKNKRPAFIPSGNTNWNGAAPLVLTLLPAGHKPGLYTLNSELICRTQATSSGNVTRAISYSAPGVGAVSIPAFSTGGTLGATGRVGLPNGLIPFAIESDGTAPVTMTFNAPAVVGGPPVVDVYASATLIGIIPP